ncbi:MAG TPA: hypothetical protein VFK52_12225 [Nocardioidaceae bacterium]|nr:hypothetical protein [Nocardioidaceae bacterium]
MARKSCNHCHQPIAQGEAVLRSINFEQIAWHQECYLVRELAPALVAAS